MAGYKTYKSLAELMGAVEAEAGGLIANSVVMRERMEAAAKRGVELAQSYAPVGDRTHTLKDGHVDEPGAYRDSITGTAVFEDGFWRGRVRASDYKAWWVEFGAAHMPKYATMRKAREDLGAELGGVYDDAADVASNWKGWRPQETQPGAGSWRD